MRDIPLYCKSKRRYLREMAGKPGYLWLLFWLTHCTRYWLPPERLWGGGATVKGRLALWAKAV